MDWPSPSVRSVASRGGGARSSRRGARASSRKLRGARPEDGGRRCAGRWGERRAASSDGFQAVRGDSERAEGAEANGAAGAALRGGGRTGPSGSDATGRRRLDERAGRRGGAETRSRAGSTRPGRRHVQARPAAEGGGPDWPGAAGRGRGRPRGTFLIALELPGIPDDALPSLAARARTAAPHDFKLAPSTSPGPSHRSSRAQPPLAPHRTFLSASGARILVGRGAEKNDALTFHVARPHDLWLHAKNRAGAHVVVPLDKDASCPADVLVDAAHLAAHFSEARDESVVEIQYTPRRYLRKPRGSAAGLVVVDREKVLILRKEGERLRALLERETQ